MKRTLLYLSTLLITLTLATTLPTTYAQDYTRFNLPEDVKLRIGKGEITDMAYSPDGIRLAVSTNAGIWIYDSRTGEELDTLLGQSSITCIAYSPDGRTLISGSTNTDDMIRLWDATSGANKTTLIRHAKDTFIGHAVGVYSLALSPDGKILATGHYEEVQLWDAVSGERKASFLANARRVVDSLAFSPDGKTIATYDNHTIHLRDAATGTHKVSLIGQNPVRSLAFSPDGKTIASGSWGEILLWDAASGSRKATLKGYSNYVAFSPDGRILAAGEGSGVQLWDMPSGQLRGTLTSHTDGVWGMTLAFSPDGKTLVSTGTGRSEINLWDVPSGQLRRTFTEHTPSVTSIAFSPDGKTITGNLGKTIGLWDAASGARKITLIGHTDIVRSVAFSPDGKIIASGSRDKTVRLWDARSGQHQRTLIGHTDGINSVAFSPDGKIIASGTIYNSQLGELWLWNAETGKYQTGKKAFHNSVAFAFSPDGQTLATQTKMGQQLMLWDAATGVVKITYPWNSSYFVSFAFSPDGKTLATGTQDGFIFLYEPPSDVLQPLGRTSAMVPPLPAQPPRIRLIYFFPSDVAPPPNVDTELRTLIEQTRDLYAAQMENHGFGRKTFQLETDANGKTVVHHVQAGKPAEDYNGIGISQMKIELENLLDLTAHIYLVVLDPSLQGSISSCGFAALSGSGFGTEIEMNQEGLLAVVSCADVNIAAHELGHTFGLPHNYRNKHYVMYYGLEAPRLSYAAAEWLDVHPYLNPEQPHSENRTTIEVLSPRASRLQFQVADPDGLHQAQLLLTEKISDAVCGEVRESLSNYKALNGSPRVTLEFVATAANPQAKLQVIDEHGNITYRDIWIEPDSTVQEVQPDVNNDGIVNIQDLVTVAAALGETGESTADVNNDGQVNIQDLVAVAAALGETAASAPTAATLSPEIVKQWLAAAAQRNLTDATSRQGIRALEALLAALIPKETALLANYPNPFNPETWIPYQLAEPADVTLRIHAVDGTLVRTLSLGHKAIGTYQSRNRAAYWDGKNEVGEPVASGVYFYTLTAGEFNATRKMIIRK